MTPNTTARSPRPILALKPAGREVVARKQATEAQARQQAEKRAKFLDVQRRQKAEQAAAAKLRVAQAQALGEKLRAVHPTLFDLKAPQPLAVGIDRAVRQRFGATQRQTRVFLSWWTKRKAYQLALIAGGARYDLDGAEQGAVSPEHQTAARSEVAKLRKRKGPAKGKPAKVPKP